MKFIIISIGDRRIMLISYVYQLFLRGRMESKISVANSHEEIFASQISTSFQFISVYDHLIMAISCCMYGLLILYIQDAKPAAFQAHWQTFASEGCIC